MILEQKPLDEILKALENSERIFIAGCTDCATTCKVGGEDEVAAMKKTLEEHGKKVTGSAIFDTACLSGEVRKKAAEHGKEMEEADAVLALTCGTGVQTIGDLTGKRSTPGANTLFVGEVVRLGKYQEKCVACGQCVLDDTEGICPVTRCSKGLQNGPCGGYREGKCEVDPEKDCAWVLIYERLRERGKLDKMRRLRPAKDFSKMLTPRTLVWKRPEAARK